MPRGRSIVKRKRQPDPIYHDERITRFINAVMLDGKKDKARKICYQALEKASVKVGLEPLAMFDEVIEKIRPEVEVRSRRVGGATYQIPVPVSRSRGEALAFRWLIEAARKTKGKSMSKSLMEEMVGVHNDQGEALKKRENIHKMAEANRAFAHFRW